MYNRNCREISIKPPRSVPWWTKELGQLRSKCRKLFNKAKKNGDWQSYRTALTNYNKEIRKAKQHSWQNFCSEMTEVSSTSRLVKVLSKDKTNEIGSIRLSDGTFTTTGADTLVEMLRVHFPGCTAVDSDADNTSGINTRSCGKSRWDAARHIVTYNKISSSSRFPCYVDLESLRGHCGDLQGHWHRGHWGKL